jgi:hypothetical protein
MSTPTTFPANVVLADGRPAIVLDQNAYIAAVHAGATHSTVTPSKTTAGGGGLTNTIQQLALSLDESDGRPPSAQGSLSGKLR